MRVFIQAARHPDAVRSMRKRFSQAARWLFYAWFASLCGMLLPITCAGKFRLVGSIAALLVLALSITQLRRESSLAASWRILAVLAVPPALIWALYIQR